MERCLGNVKIHIDGYVFFYQNRLFECYEQTCLFLSSVPSLLGYNITPLRPQGGNNMLKT